MFGLREIFHACSPLQIDYIDKQNINNKYPMNRNFSLDILKLFMAFMVVGLHAGFLGDFTSLGEYLSVNGIFRIAVPIFLVS